MSYTTRKLTRMFVDIETTANPENCALMPDPKIEAPANYKDPEKIAAYITEKTEQARADALAKAALDPDYGKILSIGFSTGEGVTILVNGMVLSAEFNTETGQFDETRMTETAMLEIFWHELANCNGYCVGYNILAFDIPYLMRRSMALGVKLPFIPNLAKFKTDPITDLMAILFNWGADRYKGLKTIAKLYKLPVLAEGVDGSMVSTLSQSDLMRYQESDILLTIELYNRMNGVYFMH